VVAGSAGPHESEGAVLQSVEQAEAVAREDGEGAEDALLQVAARSDGLAEDALVVVQQLLAAVGGASGAGAKLFELVKHFAFGDIESAREGGVQFPEGRADTSEVAAQVALAGGQLTCQGTRDGFALQPAAQVLAPAEDVADVQLVFPEEARDVRLDESEAGARQDRRHAPEQPAIEHLGLREIGNFGGASHAGRGGKQRVLDNGPEEGAGGKRGGIAYDEGDEFVQRERAAAGLEARAAHTQRQAAPVDNCEEQSGPVRHLYLLVEA